jgi:hypothetical protein
MALSIQALLIGVAAVANKKALHVFVMFVGRIHQSILKRDFRQIVVLTTYSGA